MTIANGQVASVTLAGDGGTASPLAFTALGNGGAAVVGELGLRSRRARDDERRRRLHAGHHLRGPGDGHRGVRAARGDDEAHGEDRVDAERRRRPRPRRTRAPAATRATQATRARSEPRRQQRRGRQPPRRPGRSGDARAPERARHGAVVAAAARVAVSLRQDGLAPRHPRPPPAVADDRERDAP